MPTVSELMAARIASAQTAVQTWGDIIINVKNAPYFAKGDGITDDTAAIQQAIEYAIKIGKHEVTFPAGTYKYGTLTNTEGITFVGDGVALIGGTPITLTSLGALSADVVQRGLNPMYMPAPYASAVGDGNKDDTTAIQTAIDLLPIGGILFLPSKKFRTTSKLRIEKEICIIGPQAEIYCDHTDVGILVQRPGGVLGTGKTAQVKLDVSITRKTLSKLSSAIGLHVIDCFRGVFSIARLENHGIGLYLEGLTSGTTYNQFYLGFFVDCYKGVYVTTSPSVGYVTENTFYGGNFTSGSVTDPNDTFVHVHLDNANIRPINDNKFISASFEGFFKNGVIIDKAASNMFIACRFEMPYADYFVKLLDVSLAQGNKFFNCFGLAAGLKNGKIVDEGSYNRISGSEFPVGPYEYSNQCVYLFQKPAAGLQQGFNSGLSVAPIGFRSTQLVTASTATVAIDFSLGDHFDIRCVTAVNITSITFSNIPPVGVQKTISFIQAGSGGNSITGFPSLFLGAIAAAPVQRSNGRDVYQCTRGAASISELYCIGQYRN